MTAEEHRKAAVESILGMPDSYAQFALAVLESIHLIPMTDHRVAAVFDIHHGEVRAMQGLEPGEVMSHVMAALHRRYTENGRKVTGYREWLSNAVVDMDYHDRVVD